MDIFAVYNAIRPFRGTMSFGDWLKTNRDTAKMTQEELADRAGTKHPSISRLENGKAKPSRGMVLRIAKALGVDHTAGLAAAGFLPEETRQNISVPTPKGRRVYAWDPVTGNVVALRQESLRLVDTIIDNELEHAESERD